MDNFGTLENLQVMNAAWDHGLSVSVESALPCLDVDMYSRILDTAQPRNDPDRHHLSFFAYRQRTTFLLQRDQHRLASESDSSLMKYKWDTPFNQAINIMQGTQ